jgi:hypothetical protein
MEIWRYGDMETWRHGHGDIKRKTEAKAIFLNPFVDEETNGSYPFANGLNRLNGLGGLAHLCSYCTSYFEPELYSLCNIW